MAIDQKHEGSSTKKNRSSSNNNNGSNFEKPKQPQRGLGVAQLEKIRLHTQLASCGFISQIHPAFPSLFPLPPYQYGQEDMRIQAGYQQAAFQSQFGYGPLPSTFHHPNNLMMGFGEPMGKTSNNKFGESQPFMTTRWNPNNNNVVTMPENNQYIQPQGLVTRHLLSHVEQNNKRNNLLESRGSSSRNPMPIIDNEELDLELRL
ncbi:hypothetical protein RND81_08G055100 [Saponaria officinalis]|uniref:Uncharacterized protein n=1 Tax=Saponaria officinalis TaxID=3572 RepID=A0AAW1J4D3_SAPOF